jgi:hypothetical protein
MRKPMEKFITLDELRQVAVEWNSLPDSESQWRYLLKDKDLFKLYIEDEEVDLIFQNWSIPKNYTKLPRDVRVTLYLKPIKGKIWQRETSLLDALDLEYD